MDIYEKFVNLVPKIYEQNITEENFSETVLGLLHELFPVKEAYVFFINADNLFLKYYSSNPIEKLLPFEEFKNRFAGGNVFVSDLCVGKFPFAKLVIVKNSSFSHEEIKVCASIASIAANLIKEVELTDILKMQVNALQEGMDEANNVYKLLKKQNKKILDAEKIKNEFLANVSHQLRTPLNSIIGFADMLSIGVAGGLNQTQSEYVNDIKIAGIKLLEMINEILDISKLEANSMKLFKKRFNLYVNIREVLNILRPLYLEKKISIEVDAVSDFEVFADYQKLQQVFFNLVSNAIKFVPVGGKILISAKQSDGKAVISVKDNGPGIAKKYHRRIFKKFEQLSAQNSPSTGLGLTIVKEIIKLHKGKINLISEEGKGAEFVMYLPLS